MAATTEKRKYFDDDRNELSLDPGLAIKVEALTKIYPLYASPEDRLKEALHPFRKKYHQDFFALKDVTFEVQKGDSLGVIGQNGSGKSTLLKILSRVLTPSAGTYQTSGRVISLLELGSGFNQELTGLENIYFYGTILGFSKKMIEEKLDDIIAFADIGQFIKQPIKTYSSGMRSRLAFSVASNVDPDILILDEVLAVGDMRFKQKCFRVMRDLIDQKRTVLLVTHSMGAVNSFCNKVLWLHEGCVKDAGEPAQIVKNYVSFMSYGMETSKNPVSVRNETEKSASAGKLSLKELKWTDVSKLESFGELNAIIKKVALRLRDSLEKPSILEGNEWLTIHAQIQVNKNIDNPIFGFRLKNNLGTPVFSVNNCIYNNSLKKFNKNEEVIIRNSFKLPSLTSGKYAIDIAIAEGDLDEHVQQHWIHDAMLLIIENNRTKILKSGGVVLIEKHNYEIETVGD